VKLNLYYVITIHNLQNSVNEFWSFTCTAEFNSRIVGLIGPVAAIRKMAQEYRFILKR
jgi:hypothetical protein